MTRVLLALISLSALFTRSSVAEADRPSIEELGWGAPVDGLQIAAIVPDQPFESSMSMPIKIALRNVGSATITLRRPQSPFNFRVSVFRGDAEVRARPIDNTNRGFVPDGRRDVTLAVGATDTEVLFLDGMYALTPGSYVLKILLPVREMMPSEDTLAAPLEPFTVM